MRAGLGVFLIAVSIASGTARAATEKSLQPYIDHLKSTLPEKKGPTGGQQPFIDSVKKGLPPAKDSQGYTERLRATDPKKDEPKPAEPYVETQKRRIEAEKPERGSAIQAVKEGRSELQLKRPGSISGAAGLRAGVSNTRKVTATGAVKQKEFSEIYGDVWVPDFSVFAEYQPFHSEWFGNIGLLGSIGFSQFKGTGKFAVSNLSYGSTSFGENSRTQFRFNLLPIQVGAIYRFNLLRILRPYVSGGGTAMIFQETRSDGKPSHHGRTLGVTGSVGVAILLDFLSRSTAWNMYAEHNIKHSYFTVEYTRVKSTVGEVRFDMSGVFAGLAFEY